MFDNIIKILSQKATGEDAPELDQIILEAQMKPRLLKLNFRAELQ